MSDSVLSATTGADRSNYVSQWDTLVAVAQCPTQAFAKLGAVEAHWLTNEVFAAPTHSMHQFRTESLDSAIRRYLPHTMHTRPAPRRAPQLPAPFRGFTIAFLEVFDIARAAGVIAICSKGGV